ncbi:deoxyribodipyrimidine photo-lyase [soil metagenome]
MSKKQLPVVVHWFRRDLRLQDNRGLARALASGLQVLPLFIFDEDILEKLEDEDDARVGFIHATVLKMKSDLNAHGSDLLCLHGKVQSVWSKLLDGKFDVSKVIVSGDYEPGARARDAKVEKLLATNGILFESFKDQVVFEKGEVTKDDGKPYTVYTPYAKKWRAKLDSEMAGAAARRPLREETCALSKETLVQFECEMPTLKSLGFSEHSKIVIPPLKVEREILLKYGAQRDFPAVPGTSHLGLHLRFGTVSVRMLVAKAIELKAAVWLGELIWREFFMQILWHFPHVAEFAFRPEYERITWRNNETEFAAWCAGRTGYPLVDAGMRELNATGFMHNRVRMVTASFLVKHLLVDWRWGEAYFARRLLDFDLAANNGNWQWVAGTGCDAAPYFRVFNPALQMKRFDPGGDYVQKWVPEFGTDQQLLPIVDHVEARARVLRAYAAVKQPE